MSQEAWSEPEKKRMVVVRSKKPVNVDDDGYWEDRAAALREVLEDLIADLDEHPFRIKSLQRAKNVLYGRDPDAT